ncbi:MAG TPA: YpmA family protein [Spirochaetia bacterium]|nr:YpmA family protein [Spirochaetia bacterium]
MNEDTEKGLRLIAVKSFQPCDEMYKVVDFLNKTLKERHVMFGLSKNDQGTMDITIYEF